MPLLISSSSEYQDWRGDLIERRHRGVLIYEGEAEPIPTQLCAEREYYCAISREYSQGQSSPLAPALSDQWPVVQAKQLLGTAVDVLLVDCRGGFDYALSPAMLAAAVGALRGGGVLLLWWPAQAIQDRNSCFEQRLHGFLSSLDSMVFARLSSDMASEELASDLLTQYPTAAITNIPSHTAAPAQANAEQQHLIGTIAALAEASVQHKLQNKNNDESPSTGAAQAPSTLAPSNEAPSNQALLLRADRGRGKTWALGQAVLSLHTANVLSNVRVAITAPRKAAVAEALAIANKPPANKTSGHSAAGRRLAYWAPDALLLEKPNFDLLLIDEAAAIPPAVLAALFEQYRFCVFSSTLNGYEGSGKGFELRFAEYLQQHCEKLQSISLEQPIRWAEGDPLEAALNAALLMDMNAANDMEAKPSAMLSELTAKQVTYRQLSKAELSADEALLRQCFGLLLNAHYQTSPDDLQLLLDNEDLALWIAESAANEAVDRRVLAVAMIMREGPIEAALRAEVRAGRRRLRGELIPQSILYYADTEVLADRVFARVLRIAVDKHHRRLGLGQALLSAAEQALKQDANVAGIGASYASDVATNAFWFSGGYQPIRLGLRRDPCSGSHSLLVLKAFTGASKAANDAKAAENTKIEALVRECKGRFAADLDGVLARLLHFHAEQVEQLRQCIEGTEQLADAELEAWDIRQAQRFASAEIPWEQALPSLLRLGEPSGMADSEQLAWRQCAAPQANWSAAAASLSVPGRKAVESVLRCAAQNYSSSIS